jgi:hypothetical protein
VWSSSSSDYGGRLREISVKIITDLLGAMLVTNFHVHAGKLARLLKDI